MSIEHPALRSDPSRDQKLVLSPGPTGDEIEVEAKTAEEVLKGFVTAAERRGAFLRKPPKVKNQAWNRQLNIVNKFVLEGETSEVIGKSYSRNPIWVRVELSQGIKRIWGNSPSDIQKEFPKDAVLLALRSIEKERKQAKREDLAKELGREDLNKERLRILMAQVNYEFFKDHEDLFVLLDDVIESAGYYVDSEMPRDSIVDVLENVSGIVVGSYRRKDKQGKLKRVYFISKFDEEDAEESLKEFQKLAARR